MDDDPTNLHGIGAVLRSKGYSVEASNDLQAIEVGETGPMSLFVTDMDLPHSAGTDIALKLVALLSDPAGSFHFWHSEALVDPP